MSDIDGLGILERLKSERPTYKKVLMTGHGTVPSAVEAMQRGVQLSLEAAGYCRFRPVRKRRPRDSPGRSRQIWN